MIGFLAHETGWSEKYIQNMPLYKVLLYLHTFNVIGGSNTKWAQTASNIDKIEMKELNNLIEAI